MFSRAAGSVVSKVFSSQVASCQNIIFEICFEALRLLEILTSGEVTLVL